MNDYSFYLAGVGRSCCYIYGPLSEEGQRRRNKWGVDAGLRRPLRTSDDQKGKFLGSLKGVKLKLARSELLQIGVRHDRFGGTAM